MVAQKSALWVKQKTFLYFFPFIVGTEGPDYDTPAHFLYHCAYFARRTTEVNEVACGAYFSIICQDLNM